jgi:hypothetical protein
VFSPDGQRLAVGGDRGAVLVWEAGPRPPQGAPEREAIRLVRAE